MRYVHRGENTLKIDYKKIEHHPVISELTELICNKTKNTDKSFFRIEIAYFIANVASNMRAYTSSKDRGKIPINIYTILLATSGYGKNHSIGILERELLNKFKDKFLDVVMPNVAEASILERARKIARLHGEDVSDVIDRLKDEYDSAGPYAFSFDSGTTPAVKQMRHKLILGDIGALSMVADEIGSTLLSNTEVLTTYLELFDQGLVKPKLIKNTKENKRNTIIDGKTPANMLLFGTPSKLFNGGNTEEQFMSLLETGFARRCFFALGDPIYKKHNVKDAKQLYLQAINGTNEATISKWSNYFEELADIKYYKQEITIPDEVAIELLEYQISCEELANSTKGMSELEKTELAHRYFKVIKLAGALTFIDKTNVMTLNHLAQAIKVCEESGKCFKQLLIKDKPYERLAKYIADIGTELTQADLVEALPFYNKTLQAKADMMSLAIAWGYKNNVLIKRSVVDGIEFISGESLEATDLNKLIVSYSNHYAEGYATDYGSFGELDKLMLAYNMNWCSHGFKEDYRLESNAIPGFNLIVLDIDEGQPIEWSRSVLSKYTYAIYTTKRHTEEQNRYRLIIPTNYILKLNEEDYVEFMKGIMEFLPINSDTSTAQRSRKWNTNPKGVYYSNEGELFNVLPFIPKTKQNEKYLNQTNELRSVTGLDRWFINQINEGNRNNNLIKYALALVDSGLGLHEVMERVRLLNTKIASPLDSAEINNTIAKTVSKRY